MPSLPLGRFHFDSITLYQRMAKSSKSGLPLKVWVRDRILFLAMIIFVLGGAGYISAGKFIAPDNPWLYPVKEFALLMSLIGIVSLGYELFLRELTFREYKNALQEIVNPDGVRLGIEGIYKNRSELSRSVSFESIFKKVQKEIFIGGSSLLSITTSSREQLKQKVLGGIDVRLLLLNPNSQVVELITRQGGGKATFLNEIRTSLLLLQKVAHEIDSEPGFSGRGKLLVHTYDAIPSHSFICVDEGRENGVIVADIGPYLGRSTPRPSLLVVNKKGGMYDYWRKMGELMWQESKAFNLDGDDLFGTKTKALMFTSGMETEYYDTEAKNWHPASVCQMNGNWRAIKGSQWVWVRDTPTLEEAKTGTQNRFRLKFDLPSECRGNCIVRADLYLRSDDVCHITVNDFSMKQEYGGADYPDAFLIDVDNYLKSGENVIYFELISFANPTAQTPDDSLTGIIYRLHLEYRE